MTHIDPSTLGDMLRNSMAQGNHPRLTVTSNSMAPLFYTDDQVILEAVQPEQLNLGDIVTISTRHEMLTHRIWALHDTAILTRGDHALTFDEPWPSGDVVGRIIGRTHKQHTLSFKTGLGQWLDQHLTALALREHQWLTGSQEVSFQENEPIALNTKTKLFHRFFYGWAIFITFTVNLATRIKSGDTKI